MDWGIGRMFNYKKEEKAMERKTEQSNAGEVAENIKTVWWRMGLKAERVVGEG